MSPAWAMKGSFSSRQCGGPGPETPPEKRKWGPKDVYRYSRGWLVPYTRSRILPGEFHPITAYLFIEYKCNLDCWYCWAYDNKVKAMREDVARRFMKTTCQRHCFSTLNYNLAYCYNDARVIKWLWSNVIKNKFQGGVRSFED